MVCVLKRTSVLARFFYDILEIKEQHWIKISTKIHVPQNHTHLRRLPKKYIYVNKSDYETERFAVFCNFKSRGSWICLKHSD